MGLQEQLQQKAKQQAQELVTQVQLPDQIEELQRAIAQLSQQLINQQQQITSLTQENNWLRSQLAALPETLENVLVENLQNNQSENWQQPLAVLAQKVEQLEKNLPNNSTWQKSLTNLDQQFRNLTQNFHCRLDEIEVRVATVEQQAAQQEIVSQQQAQQVELVQQTSLNSLKKLTESMKASDADVKQSYLNLMQNLLQERKNQEPKLNPYPKKSRSLK